MIIDWFIVGVLFRGIELVILFFFWEDETGISVRFGGFLNRIELIDKFDFNWWAFCQLRCIEMRIVHSCSKFLFGIVGLFFLVPVVVQIEISWYKPVDPMNDQYHFCIDFYGINQSLLCSTRLLVSLQFNQNVWYNKCEFNYVWCKN